VPTALKILRGNPGHQKHEKLDPTREPKMARGEFPEPTEHLTGDAMTEWSRIVPILQGAGLTMLGDLHGLTEYCRTVGRLRTIGRRINRDGYIQETPKGPALHPLAREERELSQALRQYLIEFGLTPASRTRIKVEAPKEKSKVESFREKHGG